MTAGRDEKGLADGEETNRECRDVDPVKEFRDSKGEPGLTSQLVDADEP